jgi:hypothetical protein
MRIANRKIIVALTISLLAALVAVGFLYPRATRPLVRAEDAELISKARGDFKAARNGTAHLPQSFPIVMRLPDRSCVEFRATQSDGTSYLVCYDNRTKRKLAEQFTTGF